MKTKTIVAALIAYVITLLLCYSLDLRKELVALRAEHEAIEQNYCPTCGTYLGEDEE